MAHSELEPIIAKDVHSPRWRVWWYAFWTFAPLAWFIPNMLVHTWPPLLGGFVLDMLFLSLGVTASLRTVRLAPQASLRVAAGVLGSVYLVLLCWASADNLRRYLELHA